MQPKHLLTTIRAVTLHSHVLPEKAMKDTLIYIQNLFKEPIDKPRLEADELAVRNDLLFGEDTMQTKENFIAQMQKPKEAEPIEDAPNEAVNHPDHYHSGTYEAINVIQAWGLNFNRGNVVKYLCRAGLKDPDKEVQDLEKALFYLLAEIESLKS